MALFKTDTANGFKPVPYHGDGKVFPIKVSFTPTALLTTADQIELALLEAGVEIVDYMLENTCTSLVGTLCTLAANNTVLGTIKAGVAAFQRADGITPLQGVSDVNRRLGFVATTAQTALGGTVTVIFYCRVA